MIPNKYDIISQAFLFVDTAAAVSIGVVTPNKQFRNNSSCFPRAVLHVDALAAVSVVQ